MRSAVPPCGDPCSPGSGWTGPQVPLAAARRTIRTSRSIRRASTASWTLLPSRSSARTRIHNLQVEPVGKEEQFGVEREAIQAGLTEQLQRSLASKALQAALRIGKRQAQERLDDTVEQQACQPADKRARGQGSIARTDGHRGGSERGHNPADISRSIGPVSIGKHHQFTSGCQHARAHAKPLATIGRLWITRTRASLAATAQATAKVSSVEPSSTTRTSTSPGPCGNSARRAASVPGRRSASLKQGRTKVRPGLEATSVSGLVGPGEPAAAGEPWCRSQLNSCNPRPQPQASQSLVRVVRRSHHPYLGSSGDNAHRGYAARREATRDGVDGCRQPGSLPPGRARQCRRTASAG
jgi:hypothetical protein